MNQNRSILTDFFLLLLLLYLLFYMGKKTHNFVNLQSKSIAHQLDQSFADELYSAQRQARITTQLYTSKENPMPEDWQQKLNKVHTGLADIEAKYGKNSVGVMLLGPIGTTSIILKEKELRQKLIIYIEIIGQLLHLLSQQQKPMVSATSVQEGLDRNQVYIGMLLKYKSTTL